MRQTSPHLLWVGHRGDLGNLRAIHAAGIACLIDVAIDEPPPAIGRELAFARFPLLDGGGNEPWLVRAAIDTCVGMLRSGQSVMVVCSSGMSRSPSIAAAALSIHTGLSPGACLTAVLGGSGDVSPAMWAQVLHAIDVETGDPASQPGTRSPPSATPPSFSMIARFRHLYEYERDCNAKVLRMLESVPEASRNSPQFARGLGKASHLLAARHMWLFRLGLCEDKPVDWFPPTTLEQLPALAADVEQRWVTYLAGLTDAQVQADIEWTGNDGKRRRWPLIDLLTQVFGHAWYHRGQIALLVKDLGGEPIDADYIFWDRPTVVD